MTKAELRDEFRRKRRALLKTDWQNRCEALTDLFFAVLQGNHWQRAVSVISSFLPIERQQEVDTWLIIRKLWQDFPPIQVAAPVTDQAAGTLEHYPITPTTEFTKSRYGIPEPALNPSSLIHPSSFDLVLVPLLAFDQTGNRVGYGGGFYDRFLSECRPDCLKIGLSLFSPVDRIDDVYRGDISLDGCLTPDRIWTFS
ncbi:5-formyltetrahydrofolate cyclo-ligase [Larkinella insperata]|uniref:5-formyltetrahydrofolate cyclo-ligase n=1 Tax=Larkinella insperata TaxID=332158 RepID=A0ABW3QIM4_9BACT|nr:5-formyltetrahydrofolate cyclo-ligase [Larkinella insperata]